VKEGVVLRLGGDGGKGTKSLIACQIKEEVEEGGVLVKMQAANNKGMIEIPCDLILDSQLFFCHSLCSMILIYPLNHTFKFRSIFFQQRPYQIFPRFIRANTVMNIVSFISMGGALFRMQTQIVKGW
jgi:hypothetical protein